jgi:hypothetical protein
MFMSTPPKPGRTQLTPRAAAEVSDLNHRVNDLRRVMASLLSRKNVLLRAGKSPKPLKIPRQIHLFE